MKKYPVILDLETKYSFRQQSDPKKLGITIVGLYDYREEKALIFEENELSKLFSLLESSSYIIGFNVKNFDIPVLSGYYPGDTNLFPVFDMLDDIKVKVGKRLSLNDLVFATLGKKKSGHGLMAIELYREGKLEELKRYCLDDVMLTKELFEYGIKTGEVMYLNEKGKASIKVDWSRYLKDQGKSDSHLTLPF